MMKHIHSILFILITLQASASQAQTTHYTQAADTISRQASASSTATHMAPLPETLDSAYLSQIDSIMQQWEQEEKIKEVEKTIEAFNSKALEREMSFSANGVFPLLRGLLFTATEHNFIKHPAAYEAKDDTHKWNDYAVGGAPLLATWIMKAAGVESRSRLERMLTANALALGITTSTSQLLKHTVNETRPDRSDNHSFPSGHTTLAYASATILSREYGHISPWITVGAYTTATATQVLRMQHNRHWINDLYTGAGIGMVGTNLAYFITDKIFGEKGINKSEVRTKDLKRTIRFLQNPSGFSLTAGTEVGNRKIEMDDRNHIKLGAALSTGFDASWSINQSTSLEIITRFVEAQTKVYGTPCMYTGDNYRMTHIDLGGRWSILTALDKRMGIRAFAGVRTTNDVCMREYQCSHATIQTQCAESYSIPSETKFECGAGMTYECLDTGNSIWGFNLDYYHTFSDIVPNRYSISTVWKVVF